MSNNNQTTQSVLNKVDVFRKCLHIPHIGNLVTPIKIHKNQLISTIFSNCFVCHRFLSEFPVIERFNLAQFNNSNYINSDKQKVDQGLRLCLHHDPSFPAPITSTRGRRGGRPRSLVSVLGEFFFWVSLPSLLLLTSPARRWKSRLVVWTQPKSGHCTYIDNNVQPTNS